MKKTLLITLLLIVGCSKEPINYKTSLVKRDGVFYTNDTNKSYSGKVFSLYSDGKKKDEGSIKDGKRNGLWTEWYTDGHKKSEGTYKDGKRNGLWTTEFYTDGQKKSEVTFRNGSEDGLRTVWWENGRKSEETTYKDGEYDGLETVWYENGQKWYERTYKDGKKNGLETWWYNNGQKRREITYKDDKINGRYVRYLRNGKRFEDLKFKDDIPYGFWVRKYDSGNLLTQGKVEGYTYDISDALYLDTDDYQLFKKEGDWWYYRDSTVYRDVPKVVGGKRTEETTKKERQIKLKVETYKDGKLNGGYQSFHNNESIWESGNYKDGERDGEWRSYISDGYSYAKGVYKDGYRDGTWEVSYDFAIIEDDSTKMNAITTSMTYKDGFEWDGWQVEYYTENLFPDASVFTEWIDIRFSMDQGLRHKATYGDGYLHQHFPRRLSVPELNAQKMVQGKWKNGNPNGKWTWWYKNGDKIGEGTFIPQDIYSNIDFVPDNGVFVHNLKKENKKSIISINYFEDGNFVSQVLDTLDYDIYTPFKTFPPDRW